ncbi:MAG: class I SAM-dependent methyltransferase, partial [Burkholderiaceae bacterium]|nr:class I SAM-dependent methyltransferase [Burkholderiaceae bacterium]
QTEADAVRQRYARRDDAHDERYSPLRPEVRHEQADRLAAMAQWLARRAARADDWPEPAALRLAEVGCGDGTNLLQALQLGFEPAHLTGLELLPERVSAARQRLPAGVVLFEGDAVQAPLPPASQHLVLAFTVFSSLLDTAFRERLARAMWTWLQPGGAVVAYDFTWDNPRNADVRGVPAAEWRRLFPGARFSSRRLTLAPPLARRAAAVHPGLARALNLLPPLRTHLMAWIEKPETPA